MLRLNELSGGGQRGGNPEEEGTVGVREAGVEGAGEIGGNYATLCTILQSKKRKGTGSTKVGRGPGLKGRGSGRFEPS